MGCAHFRTAATVTVIATCAVLAGCVTSRPDGGPSAALFKAQIGDISGGVAPGPHSVWYVQRQPAAYVKMGFATWQPEHTHGLRGWFARHFGRRGASPAAEVTGVAGANLNLPVPSRVQVTNVASGQVITVRVDDKAPLGDAILQLSPEAAKGLGGDPTKPLLIRMRYLSPVVAYNARAPLRYAWRNPLKHAPAAVQPAPTVLARANAEPVVPAAVSAAPPRPAPAPEVIKVVESHPSPAALPVIREVRAEPRPAPASIPAPTSIFRVQAGAFASLSNANHAVSLLAPAGAAVIEPMQRGATKLYRVIVPGPRDAAAAERLRVQVARIGFSDARLIRPL